MPRSCRAAQAALLFLIVAIAQQQVRFLVWVAKDSAPHPPPSLVPPCQSVEGCTLCQAPASLLLTHIQELPTLPS